MYMQSAVTETATTGRATTYVRESSGTCYHEETPPEVVRILENARRTQQRIRLWYGDTKTGRSWNEEFNVVGTISRSTGIVKIPILVATVRSQGGVGILDHCIIRIQSGGNVLYSHPNFHIGVVDIRFRKDAERPWQVFIDDEEHAGFRTQVQARRFVEFLKGQRGCK